jgi:hypothetical protein
METLLRNEELLSDSEYESAVSRSNPLEVRYLWHKKLVVDTEHSPVHPAWCTRTKQFSGTRGQWESEEETEKRHGSTLSIFQISRWKSWYVCRGMLSHPWSDVFMGDVKINQEIEGDVKQSLTVGDKIRDEEEVCTYTITIVANKRWDLLLQNLQRDARNEQELPQRPSSSPPSKESEPDHHRHPEEDHINTRPSSNTPPTIRVQDTKKDINEFVEQASQGPQPTNFLSLQHSLAEIRTRLSTLESAINANISAQSLKITGSPDPLVLDYFSLPSFRVERKNPQTVGAVLGTVKVLCVVERGLEALVGALELSSQAKEGNHGDKVNESEKGEKLEGGLMETCMAKPEAVALEMQRAVVGMKRVLKMKAGKSSGPEK